jgi:hypothetical protein
VVPAAKPAPAIITMRREIVIAVLPEVSLLIAGAESRRFGKRAGGFVFCDEESYAFAVPAGEHLMNLARSSMFSAKHIADVGR